MIEGPTCCWCKHAKHFWQRVLSVLLTDVNIPCLWSWDRHVSVLKKQQVEIAGRIEDLADLDVVFASKREVVNLTTYNLERSYQGGGALKISRLIKAFCSLHTAGPGTRVNLHIRSQRSTKKYESVHDVLRFGQAQCCYLM
jgi:hypothetical protein